MQLGNQNLPVRMSARLYFGPAVAPSAPFVICFRTVEIDAVPTGDNDMDLKDTLVTYYWTLRECACHIIQQKEKEAEPLVVTHSPP